MGAARRIGKESSATRSTLLDVTERVMLKEGYAAVSSRRIAKEVGVTPPLIHYYFPTLDDLFLAVFRRRADQQLERLTQVLDSDDPLRRVWELSTDPASGAFTVEFMALSNHRPSIKKEIAAHADRYRELEVEAISQAVADGRVDLGGASARSVMVLLGNAGRGIVMERMLALDHGHDEADALVDRWLTDTTPTVPARSRRR
jgi:AcrR family transcriptional regulator